MKGTIQDTSSSLIRPFEWLTNAASLKLLITQAMEDISSKEDDKEEGESKEQQKELSALHVGSGSSVVGEYMVEALGFDLVVNLDKDEETLEQMKDRWLQRCRNRCENPELAHVGSERLVFCPNDFAEEPFPYPSNRFDLILDKSTLDCTLCSDKAAACLLVQVYRCLKVGGCYLLISFHEYDFLAPLLSNLPGADWDVQHSTMERQVEDLGIIIQLNADHESDRHSRRNTNEEEREPVVESNLPQVSEKPPLNVFMIRKLASANSEIEDPHTLDWDAVSAHVHKCNDAWFQEHQPLLTRQRAQALKEAFEQPLGLEEAYLALFTDAEREHLIYEHFLEDWAAYLENRKEMIPKQQISYDEAILFLQEMQ